MHSGARTIFARSDIAATIYYIIQFLCGYYSRAAFNSGRISTPSTKVEGLQMPGSQSKETLPHLPLQRIPSLRNQTPSQMLKRTKTSWRRMNLFYKTANPLYYAFYNPTVYSPLFLILPSSHEHVHILGEYYMQLVFESGNYFVEHIWRYGDNSNSRTATNQEQCLIEQRRYSQFLCLNLALVVYCHSLYHYYFNSHPKLHIYIP